MTTRVPPKRCGEHPIYGIYIGGSDLDDDYKLVGNRHYKYTSQRRSAKVINSIEQALAFLPADDRAFTDARAPLEAEKERFPHSWNELYWRAGRRSIVRRKLEQHPA